jgi:thiamine pyrophosphokinase
MERGDSYFTARSLTEEECSTKCEYEFTLNKNPQFYNCIILPFRVETSSVSLEGRAWRIHALQGPFMSAMLNYEGSPVRFRIPGLRVLRVYQQMV